MTALEKILLKKYALDMLPSALDANSRKTGQHQFDFEVGGKFFLVKAIKLSNRNGATNELWDVDVEEIAKD